MLVDWKLAGAMLANEEAGVQAEFFKAFIHEMSSWGTRLQVEMQLCFVNGKLTKEEKECLSMLSYERKEEE